MSTEKNQIELQLKQVQAAMLHCLKDTNLNRLIPDNKNILGSGKMLRSQLVLALGAANGIPEKELINAAAAVDMIHGASLLHDDVIDGGIIRRGAPTFWKKYGVNGAILFGDVLMFKALSLLVAVNRVDLLSELIDRTGEVCRSEVEQELILRGSPGTWEECELVGRYKTGSLFAFAAVAGGNREKEQTDALREAGYILGTAYQLADDVLDASGNEEISGKTLGTDDKRGKTTAITATKNAPEDPVAYLFQLLENALNLLKKWPEIHGAWDRFLKMTMVPVLEKHVNASVD
ncbi:polyprenyl synthetase family protein [Pontiella agarivorans]|uniref:Polyprenyl synthetase family protein n=1 Tax=Pontiella agarivorans TaxID=3038953 RepID=A0ABU5N256_9BACT|nr:polyprenyl synthetase family protein [Pontiella agarivorans]MDZ8120488.1 polyprenyl synthetase family protein [Pontiella agarivorans]